MSLDHPHLAPQAAALMNMTDDLRISLDAILESIDYI
jgi:hypothetical protein